MEPPWHLYLRNLGPASQIIEQILKRAERTKPAAERPAPPKEQRCRNSRPKNENQGGGQKELPIEAVNSAWVKVRTLTTESCALAYQPSQKSVKTKKPRLTHT